MPHKDPKRRAAYHKRYMRTYLREQPERRSRQRQRNRKNGASYRARNREWVASYKATHPCVDCGEADPIVLDFDHVRGEKGTEVSKLLSAASLDRIAAEVAKCEMRCANCHRRITERRRRLCGRSSDPRGLILPKEPGAAPGPATILTIPRRLD